MCSERLLPLEKRHTGIWWCLITIFSQFLSVCFLNLGSLHGSTTPLRWGKRVFFPRFSVTAIVILRGRWYSLQVWDHITPATDLASAITKLRIISQRRKHCIIEAIFIFISCSPAGCMWLKCVHLSVSNLHKCVYSCGCAYVPASAGLFLLQVRVK